MDPILGAAIIGGGASLIGGMMGQNSQNRANETTAASAREQMAFQRDMSDTSYQRAVKDMKLAGINPMMAYSMGGASSPSGASAQAQGYDYSSAANGMASSAKDYVNQKRERSLMESQTSLQTAQAAAYGSQQKLNTASAKKAETDTKLLEAELPAIQSRSRLDTKRNALDEKALLLDATLNRLGQAAGIGSSAASLLRFGKGGIMTPRGEPGRISSPKALKPRSKNLSPKEVRNLGLTSDGQLFNKKTGEIYE